MKAEVRYYSRSGNTREVAEAIANAVNVQAEQIPEPVAEADILFLGSGIYAFDMPDDLKDYIKKLDPAKIRKVVLFSTTAMVKNANEKMKALLQAQGLTVSEEDFHCFGTYLLFKKGRPTAEDLAEARRFAEKVINR